MPRMFRRRPYISTVVQWLTDKSGEQMWVDWREVQIEYRNSTTLRLSSILGDLDCRITAVKLDYVFLKQIDRDEEYFRIPIAEYHRLLEKAGQR